MEIFLTTRQAKPAGVSLQAQFEEGNPFFMTINNRDGFSRPLAAVGTRQSDETVEILLIPIG
jgi:hypothetical protein